ncbi:MAG: FxSxx-COOH system tetratricopeptide repeat protein [Euryarchaeota archaeon]|nr:FxSxx-COOH system tetratricopeptide repeat protein [Euryarchaeota archaeon]
MNKDLIEERLKALEDSIRQDQDLLKSYEDKLRDETDPRLIGKYRQDIERQRESLAQHQQEYDELKEQATPAEMQKVTDLLQQQDMKLDEIQKLLPPIWNVSHHRNPNFTGRKGILSELRSALTSGEPAAWKQAVTGMGGVGKTQLAVEYIYRHKPDYMVIWWIHSAEPVTMAADYASLTDSLDLLEKDSIDQSETVRAVKRWLEHNSGWLLIFDNAHDQEVIRDYIPQGGAGHIIITSRNPDWGSVAGLLPVKKFDRADSIEFLLRRTGQDDPDAADALAAELGDLPLALEQAGAYIKATRTALTDYQELFQSRRKELWGDESPPPDYPDSVATTWSLAMDDVREESPEAADLLNLCAFLDLDEIPLEMLREGAGHLPEPLASTVTDRLVMDQAIEVLQQYSLIDASSESISVNRVVQAAVRDRMSEGDEKMWAETAIRLLSAAAPFESDTVPTHPDYPANVDQLGRKAFAEKLAKLLRRIRYENKNSGYVAPFLLHIHGPWGSGKTTMLNFLSNFLKEGLEKNDRDLGYDSSKWVVVHFNAWQHQRLGPPWWSLMNAVFHEAFQQLDDRLHAVFKLWIPEWIWRLSTGRLHYYLAFALFFWILALFIWGLFPNSDGTPTSLQTLTSFAKPLSTIIALLVTVWGVVLGISHSLLSGSARAARAFTESTNDPLQHLEKHFEKLVRRIQKPVVIVIDDLDRCNVSYTVELLEGIQTLFTKAGVTYVIAADRRWLYTSYEKYYDDFTDTARKSGRPLGQLFLEKTFQLSVSLPRLSPERQEQYWQYLIGSDPSKIHEEMKAVRNTAQQRLQQISTPEEILTEISGVTDDPIYDQMLREEAVIRLADPELEVRTENALTHFSPLLEPNPRAMKRLVNAYGVQRDLNILSGGTIEPKKLALWTIIILRWPLLAEYLEIHPEMVKEIGKETSTVDKNLRVLFKDQNVIDVIEGRGVDASVDEKAICAFTGLRTSDDSIGTVA